MSAALFENRKLLIVTKHGKEAVLAPKLEKALGVRCIAASSFDTDTLGTFSGETERPGDALTVLRTKCRSGMQLEGYDLALASEGSFGAHPTIFFATADEELLMLIDTKNNLEITSRVISLETNFNATVIHNRSELEKFLELCKFPSHAVLLKKSPYDCTDMVKGIHDHSTLYEVYERLKDKEGAVYIETDMRAIHNPSRMHVIGQAADKLIEKIASCCPECACPGFGMTSATAGLPCAACGHPTKSTLYHTYCCQKCLHAEKKWYPRGIIKEEPEYCDLCNP
ncbi:DUF6671 family protein [Flavobacterium beibuense]|uniref:DUF6671 domain-containing protein n=1 Tax=Flavobacterium beibuense TaxID=657326 RepID=A0A444WAC3_9FLAO|nr:DUF6671 family protein [Flavobacterium beibuense]RYJ42845.1 hypothetical protein NU09_1944 [Flavobacterium beibuense]